MTLQEAMKSGRPFRRKNNWITYLVYDGNECLLEGSSTSIAIRASDILASDWELQEPSMSFTRSDFEAQLRCLVWYEQVPTNNFLGTYESKEQRLSEEARRILTSLIFGVK